MRILQIIAAVVFVTAVFTAGFSAGLCVNVFMERGVPVIHGGGELVLLLAIPAAVIAGYIAGMKKSKRRRSPDEGTGYTD